MHENYHQPLDFRYNFNAFLTAIASIPEFIRKDLERIGLVGEWKSFMEGQERDPLIDSLKDGRDTSVHHEQLVIESKVTIGLYRYRKMKLTAVNEMVSDEPTRNLLARMVPKFFGYILDEEHSAEGEQIGAQRLYFEKKSIKNSEDLLTVIRRSLARISIYVAKAHEIGNFEFETLEEGAIVFPGWSDEITILLETDIDPTLVKKWGWK